jgi:8-oxo-dGTP diphosphatase
MNKHYQVVAAIIIQNNKILCVQRNQSKYDYISYKYEFPGGKIEFNETDEEALTREIKEELNLKIDALKYFTEITHHYPDFSITMKAFTCKSINEDLQLKEHVDFKWLSQHELNGLDWAAADVPIVDQLINSYVN